MQVMRATSAGSNASFGRSLPRALGRVLLPFKSEQAAGGEARSPAWSLDLGGAPPTGLIYSRRGIKATDEKPVRGPFRHCPLSFPRPSATTCLPSWREEQYPWISVTDRFLGASWTIRPAWSIGANAVLEVVVLSLSFSLSLRARMLRTANEREAAGSSAWKGRASHDNET